MTLPPKLEKSLSNNSNRDRTRVIVVANRLPVTVNVTDGGESFSVTTSSGGLVSALKGVSGMDFLWMGWPGNEIPEDLQEKVLAKCQEDGSYPVFLDSKTIDYFYNGFCNNILWPLFHYVPPPMDFTSVDTPQQEFQYYISANNIFTDAIVSACKQYPPDDQPYVWIHDYHLMLVPLLLRRRCPQLKIGWFLHTPFPTYEVFRMLPFRTEILTGLLSANLLAFHVYDYQRHFMQCCQGLLGLDAAGGSIDATPLGGGIIKCTSIPIGIEPLQFVKNVKTPEVHKSVEKMSHQYGLRKVILGVDRLDYMKGIPHKLNAFDRFLELHPEWNGRVVLVQLAVPSRSVVPEYQRLKSAVHEIVGKINGRRGYLGFIPVHYLDQSLNFTQLTALYRLADVAFISSLRDGMNLVAFEYIASQQNKHGVLVLSEFTGASQSLAAGAITVNPWNLDHTANALHEALMMSDEEKRSRHDYCFRYVLAHTSQRWAEAFLDALFEACEEGEKAVAGIPPLLDSDSFIEAFVKATNSLLMVELLDCMVTARGRGGLPAKRLKSLLHVPLRVLSALKVVAGRDNTCVILSSGAPPSVMDKLFGNIAAILVAEKGCSFRTLDGTWLDLVTTEDLADHAGWAGETRKVVESYQKKIPGSYTEVTLASVAWYWDQSQIEIGQQYARELLVHLWAGPLSTVPQGTVEVNLGPCSVEIRPASCSREKLLRRVMKHVMTANGGNADWDLVACFGTYRSADESIYNLFAEIAHQSSRSGSNNVMNSNTTNSAQRSKPTGSPSAGLSDPVLEQPQTVLNNFYSVTASTSLSRAKYRLPNVESVQDLIINCANQIL